jgi:hypothetical protein
VEGGDEAAETVEASSESARAASWPNPRIIQLLTALRESDMSNEAATGIVSRYVFGGVDETLKDMIITVEEFDKSTAMDRRRFAFNLAKARHMWLETQQCDTIISAKRSFHSALQSVLIARSMHCYGEGDAAREIYVKKMRCKLSNLLSEGELLLPALEFLGRAPWSMRNLPWTAIQRGKSCVAEIVEAVVQVWRLSDEEANNFRRKYWVFTSEVVESERGDEEVSRVSVDSESSDEEESSHDENDDFDDEEDVSEEDEEDEEDEDEEDEDEEDEEEDGDA